MLRPKRMSKVSVTGSKAVMDDVIELTHELYLLHLNDYDGRWEGFDNGTPLSGGDAASEKLVTVRSLKSILGVEPEDAGRTRILTEETIDEELERVRTEANELDDRRDEVSDELRSVREAIDAMAPFATLGIDLDLLRGYDSLSVAVGEGDEDSVRRALEDLSVPTQVFSDDGVVAAFAETDEDDLADALVDADFAAIEVPERSGDPEEVLADLRQREQQLESRLKTIENELEELRYDAAGFLLAAEETLSIEAKKAEAPLSFATTENAFVAEGWLPNERVAEFESELTGELGDHVEVEELEVAAYSRHGHAETTEEVHDDAGTDPAEATGDGGQEVRSDGGVVTMNDEDPPIVQDNPSTIQPFELLTKAVGRPNYSEFDPTILLFLTFPLMFGFIIGDLGYGIIYAGIGYYLYSNYDSDAFRNLGIITIAAGVMTAVFGVLYGEIFGLHRLTGWFWEPVFGMHHPPIEKGLSGGAEWAQAWFIVTTLFGVVHISIAYLLEFAEQYTLHGLKEAIIESGSWLLALNGLWLFVLSRPPTGTEAGETVLHGPKPEFIYHVFDQGSDAAIALGFSGVPSPFSVATPIGLLPLAELVGIVMILAGALLLAIGPTAELVEFHQILAHALSYLRIAAVLLAKAGMAFAVNLLFFGAYEDESGFHFLIDHGPAYVDSHEGATMMFEGMMHGGPAMLVFGILVLVAGHLIVLILGVTSAGIQSVRLEYFEFFSKFYEGNGKPYRPFGTDRSHTEEQ